MALAVPSGEQQALLPSQAVGQTGMIPMTLEGGEEHGVLPRKATVMWVMVIVCSFSVWMLVGQEGASEWGLWNPLIYYRHLTAMASTPWAWLNPSVGRALADAKKEVVAMVAVAGTTGAAYACGGPRLALQMYRMSQGAIANGVLTMPVQSGDPAGARMAQVTTEPEWVDSAMPPRQRRSQQQQQVSPVRRQVGPRMCLQGRCDMAQLQDRQQTIVLAH